MYIYIYTFFTYKPSLPVSDVSTFPLCSISPE